MDAAYLKTFEAEVVAVPPEGVVLDQTLFYPVGGGQDSDQGTLTAPGKSPVKVADVRRMSGKIVHRLAKGGNAAFQVGMHLAGEIDWPRRHINMRLHTAQHLLSAMAYKRYGLRTLKAAMSGRKGHLDLEGALPEDEDIEVMEAEANNNYFTKPVPVDIKFVTRAEFEAIPGRSNAKVLPPGVTNVRLIIIEGIDRCACGGTHVRSTEEVGIVNMFPPTAAPEGGQRLSFELAPDE
jgi:Ser-tRNA(Ala) deacylase AlaX